MVWKIKNKSEVVHFLNNNQVMVYLCISRKKIFDSDLYYTIIQNSTND